MQSEAPSTLAYRRRSQGGGGPTLLAVVFCVDSKLPYSQVFHVHVDSCAVRTASVAHWQNGTTPLVYIAVKFGRQDIVQFLVEECHVALNSDQMVGGASVRSCC